MNRLTYVGTKSSISFPPNITCTSESPKFVTTCGVLVAIVVVMFGCNRCTLIHIMAWFISIKNFEKSLETWTFVSCIVHSRNQIITASCVLKKVYVLNPNDPDMTFVWPHLITMVGLNGAFIDIITDSPVAVDVFVTMIAWTSKATRIIVASGISVTIMNSFRTLVLIATFFRGQFRFWWNIYVNISRVAIAFIWSFSVSAFRVTATFVHIMFTWFFRLNWFQTGVFGTKEGPGNLNKLENRNEGEWTWIEIGSFMFEAFINIKTFSIN